MKVKLYATRNFFQLTKSCKAYQIETSYNQMTMKSTYTFVPESVCRVQDNSLYIPAWLVSQNDLWYLVEDHNTIIIEVERKQKSAEEKKTQWTKKFNESVAIFFNGEVPEKFIVKWQNDKHTQYFIEEWHDQAEEWCIEDEEDYEIMSGLL